MTVLEKGEPKAHQPFVRVKGLPAMRTVIRSGHPRFSIAELETARKSATPFAKDFYWEHFSTSEAVLLTAIPGSGSIEALMARKPEVHKFGSPNCVYLG